MNYFFLGKYTSLCDVWSYGVLVWEIFSKGGNPYSGMSNSQAREKIDAGIIKNTINIKLLNKFCSILITKINPLPSGYRLPAPDGTPEEVYRLMLRCWEYEPEKRPHFDQIYTIVETFCLAFNPPNIV